MVVDVFNHRIRMNRNFFANFSPWLDLSSIQISFTVFRSKNTDNHKITYIFQKFFSHLTTRFSQCHPSAASWRNFSIPTHFNQSTSCCEHSSNAIFGNFLYLIYIFDDEANQYIHINYSVWKDASVFVKQLKGVKIYSKIQLVLEQIRSGHKMIHQWNFH